MPAKSTEKARGGRLPTQARSRGSRGRILDAARDLFAKNGFDRTTVRAIAAAARIDPAMVIRYFGSKSGLFTAAAEFDIRLPNLCDWPGDEIGERLVSHFLHVWEGPNSGEEFPLLVRSAVTQPEALEKLKSIFEGQLVPAVKTVVGGKKARDTAALISSQILGLAFTRHVLQLPAVAALSKRSIVQLVGPVIQAYIDAGRGSPNRATVGSRSGLLRRSR